MAGRSPSRRVGAEAAGIVGKAAGTTLRKAKRTLTDAQRAARERSFRDRAAGTTHPRTRVPFDDDGNPIFPSQYEHDLPPGTNRPDVSDTEQFRGATRDLAQAIEENPGLARQFTDEQLAAIRRGEPRIPGYTWHHAPDGVTLQLVDTPTHNGTFHYGGRHATGGRS